MKELLTSVGVNEEIESRLQANQSNKKTGQKRKNWKFYNALGATLGPKPTTRPPIVVDTLEGDGETGDFT